MCFMGLEVAIIADLMILLNSKILRFTLFWVLVESEAADYGRQEMA